MRTGRGSHRSDACSDPPARSRDGATAERDSYGDRPRPAPARTVTESKQPLMPLSVRGSADECALEPSSAHAEAPCFTDGEHPAPVGSHVVEPFHGQAVVLHAQGGLLAAVGGGVF